MRLSENMRILRKRAGLSQGDLAQQMAERGRPWHQTTVSRIERGSQELDSLQDINALQGILGTELLDSTALSSGRENDDSKRIEETIKIVETLKRIKTDLADLQQTVDDLITDIGPVRPRERLGRKDAEALIDKIVDLDPRADKKTVARELAAELARALEEITSPDVDGHRPERGVFGRIHRDFESRVENPAEGTGADAEAYLREQEGADRGVDQETT